MTKKILISFFLLAKAILVFPQLNLDSIFKAADTVKLIERKLRKIERLSMKEKLINRDQVSILAKLDEYLGKAKNDRERNICVRYKGNILWYQQRFNDALVEYFKLLKMAEKVADTMYIRQAHQDIAETYASLKNNPLAIRHFYHALEYAREGEDNEQLGNMYNALGNSYKDSKIHDSALKYHNRSLVLRQKANDQKGISYSYNNIGLVYMHMDKNAEAMEYFNRSLKIKRELKDERGVAGSLANISILLRENKEYQRSLTILDEALKLAARSKAGSFYKNAVEGIAASYYGLEKYKEAAGWFKYHKTVSDSLQEETVKKQFSELSAKYEAEQKDNQIMLKEAELKSTLAENRNQRTILGASAVALILACIAIFFIYRSFKLNRENARELAAKNAVIEEKQKEIIDSIKYAKRIQVAHMPTEKHVASMLERSGKK